MYADSALLVMRGGHLDSYVYLNKDNGEICSYHIVDPWYFKRFEPWDADDKILRYGVPYIVRHKELNLHLAARESDERPVSHSEYKFHPGRRSRMIGSSPAAMNESIVRVDTVYLTQSSEAFHCFWTFERAGDSFTRGGAIEQHAQFYIRCSTTGKYLTKQLRLVSQPQP